MQKLSKALTLLLSHMLLFKYEETMKIWRKCQKFQENY